MRTLASFLRCLAIAGAGSALSGCFLHAEPEPVAYVETTGVPYGVNIEAYPYVHYQGRPVYLYDNRWWYRDGSRWNYYRQEPAPLYQYRQRPYIQQAPPAPRAPSYGPPGYAPPGYAPPGAVPAPAPPPSAPPAVRVQ